MRHLAALLLAVGAAGCCPLVYSGPKPVHPAPYEEGLFRGRNVPRVVGSVQPLLEWEPSKEPGVTYDLRIYQAVFVESFADVDKAVRRGDVGPIPKHLGPAVYSREGLATAAHIVEEPLPKTRNYYWTVRERRGNEIGEWALYGRRERTICGCSDTWDFRQPFLFGTPRE